MHVQSGSCGSWWCWCHGAPVAMLVSHLLLHVSLCPGEVQGAVSWRVQREGPESQKCAAKYIQRGLFWGWMGPQLY